MRPTHTPRLELAKLEPRIRVGGDRERLGQESTA